MEYVRLFCVGLFFLFILCPSLVSTSILLSQPLHHLYTPDNIPVSGVCESMYLGKSLHFSVP